MVGSLLVQLLACNLEESSDNNNTGSGSRDTKSSGTVGLGSSGGGGSLDLAITDLGDDGSGVGGGGDNAGNSGSDSERELHFSECMREWFLGSKREESSRLIYIFFLRGIRMLSAFFLRPSALSCFTLYVWAIGSVIKVRILKGTH